MWSTDRRTERGMLGAYLRRHGRMALLLGALFVWQFAIYGLYGLPWGPAAYVALLTLTLAVVLAFLGYRSYRQRYRMLKLVVRQAATHLGELPHTTDGLEQAYQQALREQEKRCQAAEEQARRSARQAREYYTLWSHQIKTPLAALELLAQEEPLNRSAFAQELFKTGQYVDMALQYQRLDGQARDLVLRALPLRELVHAAARRTSTLFIHKHVRLQLGKLDGMAVTDEKWLVFVLEQLLTNAVKYTPQGKEVTVDVDPAAPCTLRIRDTGIGIRPEDLPRVCEWGYTGYNGRMDKRATGIGLSLCKQALELLGHSLKITSKVGEGTTVWVDLSRDQLEME